MREIQCGDLVMAMRNEHLLAVPAGDNVRTLLPPLIVDVEEAREALVQEQRRARHAVQQRTSQLKRTGFHDKDQHPPAFAIFLDLSAVQRGRFCAPLN